MRRDWPVKGPQLGQTNPSLETFNTYPQKVPKRYQTGVEKQGPDRFRPNTYEAKNRQRLCHSVVGTAFSVEAVNGWQEVYGPDYAANLASKS
jgi:hypothetical protein